MKTFIFALMVSASAVVGAANLMPGKILAFTEIQGGGFAIQEFHFPLQECWPLIAVESHNPFLIAQIRLLRKNQIRISVTNIDSLPQEGVVVVFHEDPVCPSTPAGRHPFLVPWEQGD